MTAEYVSLDSVRRCFSGHRGLPNSPPDWLIQNTAYLIHLARMQPREFIYGKDRAELAEAIRTILDVLPRLIPLADSEAAKAKAEGRSTDMDRFASKGRDLYQAAQPFKNITKPLNRRGQWHGWARLAAMEVRMVLERMQPRISFMPDHPMNQVRARVSFAKETSAGTQIICKLMSLAGFSGVTPSAVIEALRNRPKKGG